MWERRSLGQDICTDIDHSDSFCCPRFYYNGDSQIALKHIFFQTFLQNCYTIKVIVTPGQIHEINMIKDFSNIPKLSAWQASKKMTCFGSCILLWCTVELIIVVWRNTTSGAKCGYIMHELTILLSSKLSIFIYCHALIRRIIEENLTPSAKWDMTKWLRVVRKLLWRSYWHPSIFLIACNSMVAS